MHAAYMLVKSVVPKIPLSAVSEFPWVMSAEKNYLFYQRHDKIVEMDDFAIYRQSQKWDFCYCKIGFAS